MKGVRNSMEVEFSLPYTYDFDRALNRLVGNPVNSVNLEKRFIRVPMQEGNNVTIQATGTTQSPSFICKGAESNLQIEEVKTIFQFAVPLDAISTHFIGTDLELIFKEHKGTPLIRSFSLYSELIKSIIHQQLNLSFANTLLMRFVETYGKQKDGVWHYPSPEQIAVLEVSDLRDLQFSGRKAEYVIGLSQSIASGELDLESFRNMSNDEVIAQLVSYRGVGPWTAQGFLMFGLGRPNLFPLADIGLQNALKQVWELDRKPTQDEMITRLPNWEPYLSYAALYLWRSIE